jgi:hypothetical protein
MPGGIRQRFARKLICQELSQGASPYLLEIPFDSDMSGRLEMLRKQSERLDKAAGTNRRLPEITDKIP